MRTFASYDAFLEAGGEIDLSTPIYIDSDLGDGIRGEECARMLKDIGHHTIYLATGFAREAFADQPWLDGIVGKEAPQ